MTRSPDDVASESSSRGGPAAPAIAKTLLAAAPEPHRSPALSWWADRAAESTYPGRTIALLEILRHLVVGLAAPAPAPQEEKSDVTDHRPVSLNASGILNTLAEMLVVRSSLAGSASDPVVHSIYSTLAALVETSDRIGYPSQLDDLASETITLLAALNQSEEHEFPVEEVRIERLTAGMDGSTKARARERLVVLLKMLVEPARAAGVAAASTATRIDQHLEEQIPTTLPSTHELRPAAADNSVEASHDSPSSSGGPDLPKQDTVVPPVGAATAAAAAAVTAIPGLALGAPVERESAGAVETAGARVGATQEQQQQREEGAQDRAQPIFLVHPPSSGHLDSITTTSAGGGGSDAHDTGGTTPLSFDHAADAHAHANALSPYTVSRSLFLLSDSYPAVRSAYVDFLSTFLRQFASRTTEEANKAAETDAFWRKLAVEFHAAAAAATATSPAEEKRMTRLAEAAFSIRSGSAVLACLPMLLSQLQTQNAIAQHALATLARTWHVNIPATTADVVVDAFASDAGVQSATGRDRAQLVETLSTRWVYGSARQAGESTSLLPYTPHLYYVELAELIRSFWEPPRPKTSCEFALAVLDGRTARSVARPARDLSLASRFDPALVIGVGISVGGCFCAPDAAFARAQWERRQWSRCARRCGARLWCERGCIQGDYNVDDEDESGLVAVAVGVPRSAAPATDAVVGGPSSRRRHFFGPRRG